MINILGFLLIARCTLLQPCTFDTEFFGYLAAYHNQEFRYISEPVQTEDLYAPVVKNNSKIYYPSVILFGRSPDCNFIQSVEPDVCDWNLYRTDNPLTTGVCYPETSEIFEAETNIYCPAINCIARYRHLKERYVLHIPYTSQDFTTPYDFQEFDPRYTLPFIAKYPTGKGKNSGKATKRC